MFKPLVASSLVLSFGIAEAQATNQTSSSSQTGCSETSAGIHICYKSNGGNLTEVTTDQKNKLISQDQSSEGHSSFIQTKTYTESGRGPETIFAFTAGHASSLVVNDGKFDLGTSGNNSEIKISTNANSNGLQIGDNGQGTLILNQGGNLNNNPRTINLDLKGYTEQNSKKVSLKGNLEVQASGNSTTNVTLGEDMVGNIIFKRISYGSIAQKTNFTFEHGSLTGNITISNGGFAPTTSFDFKQGSITGGITASGSGTSVFTFSGENAKITEKIKREKASGVGNNGKITVDFAKNGSVGGISSDVGSINVSFGGNATFTGNIATTSDWPFTGQGAGARTEITMKGNNSTLTLGGSENQITKLTLNNTIVDLVGSENSRNSNFKRAEIGQRNKEQGNTFGLQGEGTFKIFVDINKSSGGKPSDTYGYTRSDRIVLWGDGHKSGTNNLDIVFKPGTDFSKISYKGGGTEKEGNIAVATAKTNSGVKFEYAGAKQVIGFDTVSVSLTTHQTDVHGKANQSGNKDYTTYFLQSATVLGTSEANSQSLISALGSSYDLYLANINSLNKRMGELRNDPHSQGAWARVFNGMQSSNFALQTKAIYTTIQAGYDYAFGSVGANNYVGLALSYANSMTDVKNIIDSDGRTRGIDALNSNAVELAIYNAYVQDGASSDNGWKNGLYSDTILKMSYIVNDVKMIEQSNKNTQNFAFTLGEEIGYRFLLGDNKEWIIDPQVELVLGYLNQSHLKQVLGDYYLNGTQNSILNLRSRVGSSFGYRFDSLTQDQGYKASLYLGAYYVYDYIAGGDLDFKTSLKHTKINFLDSTDRFTMNIGTNFEIQDKTRIYFDFEKSFGGKIITDYQINLGVRYSFGEGSKYTPYPKPEEIEDKTSLKQQ